MSVSIHGISYLKVVELLQGAHNFKIYPFPIFFGLLYIWNLLLFCSYVNIQYDSINNKHHDINLTGIIIIIIMLLFFFIFITYHAFLRDFFLTIYSKKTI